MRAAILLFAVVFTACDTADNDGSPSGPSPVATFTVGANQLDTTIQAALDAAPANAVVRVLTGTYVERLNITKPVTLQGAQAILDGLAGGLDGRYVGIEVRSNDVEISGFAIQHFERGIVVESASNFRLRDNEVRHNTSKDLPPISAGVTKSDGVVLFSVQHSEISENFIHDNGSIGLLLAQRGGAAASNDNTVRRNRFVNNGTQQGVPGSGNFGSSIEIAAPAAQNQIVDNDLSGSYWGIIIYGHNNTVQNNRITGNSRAGIMVYGARNVIDSNTATGNGSANFDPSCRYDLMDIRDIDNTWRGNSGTFGSGEPPYVNPVVSLFCQ